MKRIDTASFPFPFSVLNLTLQDIARKSVVGWYQIRSLILPVQWNHNEITMKSQWIPDEITIKAQWNHNEDTMKSQWNHNEITMESQCKLNEFTMKSQWIHDEITIKAQWNHNEVTMKSQWNHNEITMKSQYLDNDNSKTFYGSGISLYIITTRPISNQLYTILASSIFPVF